MWALDDGVVRRREPEPDPRNYPCQRFSFAWVHRPPLPVNRTARASRGASRVPSEPSRDEEGVAWLSPFPGGGIAAHPVNADPRAKTDRQGLFWANVLFLGAASDETELPVASYRRV